jgi:DNA repair protein RadC
MARQKVQFQETFKGPQAIAAYFMEDMRHLECEKCIALYLDSKCHMLSETTLSIGSINNAFLSKRELFRNALKINASQVILLHNHPSGDPTPSREDVELTKRIQEAAILMEIPLVDHIIIGDHTYISFREKGML